MISVQHLTASEWKGMSKEAHLLCFNEVRNTEMDRIDFALLATNEDKPLAYMTCRELDRETVYLQYGGSFPETKGTANSFRAYDAMLTCLFELGYERAGTYIENTNKTMLKFAMKAGWLITGLRNFEGTLLLEHTLKFQGE